MSDTRVSLLTPSGTGAIATIEIAGPRAWEFARNLFRPSGKPLPDSPELHRFWFGKLGEGAGDEVILAATGVLASGGRESPARQQTTLEVHCHGGRRVVRWIVEQFVALGCIERERTPFGSVLDLLSRAPTLRTAAILLDQAYGAFDNAVRHLLTSLEPQALRDLARFASVGRHLVDPWKVVIAGPPNVGKSSLVNALAGYQRAVVSEVPGTTRDVVAVQVAFDGWPVELSDTAGLREAEGLEAEGIDRAKRVLSEADLVMWLMDASQTPVAPVPRSPGWLMVWNKADLVPGPVPGFAVSALKGTSIPELASEIVRRLMPAAPPPGAAVPFTPMLADLIEAADVALSAHRVTDATQLLRDSLAGSILTNLSFLT